MKVFIVIEVSTSIIFRVFSRYYDAVAYGEQMVRDGTIEEFDICEREVY